MRAVQRELGERRVYLDLGWDVADLLRQPKRLAVGIGCGSVVAVEALEVMPEREQRDHGLVRIGVAREMNRSREVFVRLRRVADATEHAAEDPVGAAREPHLIEPLRQTQRLLRRVDRKHVVARLHVQPRGLLVQPHERERRLAVLDQVDAALVVLDRLPALALVGQRRPDLAVQLRHPLGVLALAVVLQRRFPARPSVGRSCPHPRRARRCRRSHRG